MIENNGIDRFGEKSYIFDLGANSAFVNELSATEIRDVIGDDEEYLITPVPVIESLRGYVPWGDDNNRPYKIVRATKEDEVVSENAHFNGLTLYGSGLKIKNENATKQISEDVKKFFMHNRPVKYLLDQCADMKHFFFTVSVIILNNEGSKIVKLRHKEAIHVRFETCNPITGKIEHLFSANWENRRPGADEIEVIPVLDYYDPLGDLEERFGRIPNDQGKTREQKDYDKGRKFAIINVFPTVGQKYYPFVPWWSIFNSGWYAYKRAIPGRKLDKITTSRIKYKVDIYPNYFEEIYAAEKITTDTAKDARRKKELQGIKGFLEAKEKSDKVFVGGCYVNSKGDAIPKVMISVVDNTKEGGDLIEDSAEASNMICYPFGIHPSIIGAYPGKNQGSFSGTAQRELFTLKQSLEKPFQDILLEPYLIIREFNGWEGVDFDLPVITLTTLDKGKDAQENTLRNNQDTYGNTDINK